LQETVCFSDRSSLSERDNEVVHMFTSIILGEQMTDAFIMIQRVWFDTRDWF